MIISYALFVTACGCSKMVQMRNEWEPKPYIELALTFPAPVGDWVQGSEPQVPTVTKRKFRLEREELLEDDLTGLKKKIFTYFEVQ